MTIKDENLKAAAVAIKSVHNHKWCLKERAVVLSIFGNELDFVLRKSLVEKLPTIPRLKSYAPSFPKFSSNLSKTTIDYPNLSDNFPLASYLAIILFDGFWQKMLLLDVFSGGSLKKYGGE